MRCGVRRAPVQGRFARQGKRIVQARVRFLERNLHDYNYSSISSLHVEARNVLLFSKREAARGGIVLPTADARAQHISKHLKSQEGDSVRVGVVNGLKGTALVKAVSGEGIRLAWNTWEEPPPPAPVALVLAMPRPRVMRRLWRQIAELGISRVVLTITDTVPPGYSTSEALRPHVVLREVLQGLEQAGDTLVPEIVLEPSLSAALGVAEGPWGAPEQHGGSTSHTVAKEWGPRKTLVPPPPILQRSQAIHATHASHASTSSPSSLSGSQSSIRREPAIQKAPGPKITAVTDVGGPRGGGGASIAKLGGLSNSGGDSGADDSSERLAFITQCLQVRRRQHEQRWGNAQSASSHPSSHLVGVTDGGAVHVANSDQRGERPPGILKVMCHPQDSQELLSDVVVRYGLQLRRYGANAWNHSPSNNTPSTTPEAPVSTSASEAGGAGDYYYGSAEPSLQGSGHFDENSFIGMCTEALNIVDREAYSAAAVAAAAAVTAADTVKVHSVSSSDPNSSRIENRENSSSSLSNGGSKQPLDEYVEDSAVSGYSSTSSSNSSISNSISSSISSSTSKSSSRRSSTGAVGTTAVSGKEWGRGHVVVCVGPERGWSEREIAMLESGGYVGARMGSRILSSSTAVVSAVAIVQEALR